MAKDRVALQKAPSGVKGLDELTNGGFPKGRPTLICGAAGCGKTLLATEFLVRGALDHDEPGIFMMFEENSQELAENVSSMGIDLMKLQDEGRILLDHVYIERSEIDETGEYDLEGLFIRLGHAVDRIGAKRVVLDTLEALFTGLQNEAVLRAELRRLFRWLKERGLTAVITAERGEGSLTRYGMEEYVADCVILLDHRVKDQISTRRLRVVKYRGSAHGTNEYPFLINEKGISVLPITSLKLEHEAPLQRVSTGIAKLDEMFGGEGVYRGSSVLVSGTPGTGKTSVAAMFAHSTCMRGERCILFSYEESPEQFIRNMKSINVDLRQWMDKGLLMIHSSRPTYQGLEQHLVEMYGIVDRFKPDLVIVDPISNLTLESDPLEVKPTLMRLIDLLKQMKVTAVFTSLTDGSSVNMVDSEVGVSSLMDTWLLLRNQESNGENTRTLFILKSRGMRHSNQVREFVMTSNGVDLIDVYLGMGKVLTGTARSLQENADLAMEDLHEQVQKHRLEQLQLKRKALDAQIAALQARSEAEAADVQLALMKETMELKNRQANSMKMAIMRDGHADQQK